MSRPAVWIDGLEPPLREAVAALVSRRQYAAVVLDGAVSNDASREVALCICAKDPMTAEGAARLEALREASGGAPLVALCRPRNSDGGGHRPESGSAELVRIDLPPEEMVRRCLAHARAHPKAGATDGYWCFKGREERSDLAAREIVGDSPQMQALRCLIRDYASTEATVLISGETGTGKELVAHEIHRLSPRRTGPFVAVNCAAIPEHLIEGELFGSVRGAYTGSVSNRHGLFAEAQGGTLLLDEIGELPLLLQSKLLRVIESGTYRRLGANAEVQTDARVVSATNRNLVDLVEEGRFREDLYYRLNVLRIDVPPLRERRSDIPLLVAHVLGELLPPSRTLWATPEAMAELMSVPWRGNVRELKNTLQRTVVRRSGDLITRFSLDDPGPSARAPRPARSDVSCSELVRLLLESRGRLGPVAGALGVSVRTVQRRMKEYGLTLQDFRRV